MANNDRFSKVRLPRELPGLTADLLFQLLDATIKYGRPVPGRPDVHRLGLQFVGQPIHVSAQTGGAALYISCNPGHLRVQDAHVMQGPDQPFVVWEKSLTVEAVRVALAATDAFMAEIGVYDPATGERRAVNHDRDATEKMSVDKIFRPVHRIVLALSSFRDARALAGFDRPEDLLIIGAEERGVYVTTKRGRELRTVAETEVLRRRGLTAEDVLKLPPAEQQAIMREIETKLDDVS